MHNHDTMHSLVCNIYNEHDLGPEDLLFLAYAALDNYGGKLAWKSDVRRLRDEIGEWIDPLPNMAITNKNADVQQAGEPTP